jgi:hypothetical protein
VSALDKLEYSRLSIVRQPLKITRHSLLYVCAAAERISDQHGNLAISVVDLFCKNTRCFGAIFI